MMTDEYSDVFSCVLTSYLAWHTVVLSSGIAWSVSSKYNTVLLKKSMCFTTDVHNWMLKSFVFDTINRYPNMFETFRSVMDSVSVLVIIGKLSGHAFGWSRYELRHLLGKHIICSHDVIKLKKQTSSLLSLFLRPIHDGLYKIVRDPSLSKRLS